MMVSMQIFQEAHELGITSRGTGLWHNLEDSAPLQQRILTLTLINRQVTLNLTELCYFLQVTGPLLHPTSLMLHFLQVTLLIILNMCNVCIIHTSLLCPYSISFPLLHPLPFTICVPLVQYQFF